MSNAGVIALNIDSLQRLVSRIGEVAVIGKNAEVEGIVCHVMGVVRYGRQMRLLVLQYDETFQERVEEAELAEACAMTNRPKSNRMVLRGAGKIDPANPLQPIRRVCIGEREFVVPSFENRRLGVQDAECILLISKFLHEGWKPNGIEYPSLDMLFLISLELDGEYEAIPAFGESPTLRFIMGEDNASHLVEHPVTLRVGGDFPDKLYFQDALSGEEHWLQINSVYLSDMWAEMAKVFDNPKLQEHMTQEEIERAKLDFERRFSEVCPKGMRYPIVEYESEDDISVQFYSRKYLDATPVSTGSAMGFIVRPDQPTGVLGLKLKAAIIQEPVSADTTEIEAELFRYNRVTTCPDIVLK